MFTNKVDVMMFGLKWFFIVYILTIFFGVAYVFAENEIDINAVGDNAEFNLTQTGDGNQIDINVCHFSGQTPSDYCSTVGDQSERSDITITQPGNNNEAEVFVWFKNSDDNDVTITQTTSGGFVRVWTNEDDKDITVTQNSDSNVNLYMYGVNITATVSQSGANGHYAQLYTKNNGTNNTMTLTQSSSSASDGRITMNKNVDNAVVTATQSGSGAHDLDVLIKKKEDASNLTITQTGSGSHTANITVENGSGGAQTYTLLQQGSTNQSVTVSFTCNTAGGCSASLTQGS